MFVCLIYGNEPCLSKGFELIAQKRPNEISKLFICIGFLLWQLEAWLDPVVPKTLLLATEKLLAMENIFNSSLADIIENHRNLFRHWKGRRYENVVHVIEAIIPESKFRYRKKIENFDRPKCIDILIDWGEDVTTQTFAARNALSYAIEHKSHAAIAKLLGKGSFIDSAVNINDVNVCNIDPKLLEKHFDSCISKCVDDNSFTEINFKNLIDRSKSCNYCNDSCVDAMRSIHLIANSKEHKHLLAHPLITTFVLLKWNGLAFVFYIDFLLYSLFAATIVAYILTEDNDIHDGLKYILMTATIISTIYVTTRRILRQIFVRMYKTPAMRHRLRENLQFIHTSLMVGLIVLILSDVFEEFRPIFATVCILLVGIELFVLAGSLFWSFSKYYVMFLDVALNSLKSLQLCIILLPAFAISFHLLLRNPPEDDYSNFDKNNKSSDAFISLGPQVIVKIAAMSLGEFDVDDFEKSTVSCYLFLGFAFFVTAVFMNLMNGLAVTDTQQILSHAEATSLIQRVRLLADYEEIKAYKCHWFR